jgi:NAD(P)H-dependent FMN reductase
MNAKKNIFVIIGSAGKNSANEKLIDNLEILAKDFFDFTVFKDLKTLPHFDPQLSTDSPPKEIINFRNRVEKADGIIICTPEYVFSIPAGLKNAIEWCVATTIFSGKPTGLITASASGQKGQEELRLIMKTLMAKFTDETTLLIRGVKGKINGEGDITDEKTKVDLAEFLNAFRKLIAEK